METLKSRMRMRKERRRGSVLVGVMILGFILVTLLTGIAIYVVDMNRLTQRKWQVDQAQYVASAGLAHLLAWLNSLPNAPTYSVRTEVLAAPSGYRVTLPTGASYRMFLSQTAGSSAARRQFLLESVASYGPGRPVLCKAQLQITQESFAKWEQYTNLAPVNSGSAMKEYQDFGTIGLGPIHCNSGANIFSSCLFAKPVTSGAPSARFYTDIWAMYNWVMGNLPNSQNYVNVAGPYAPAYPYQTIFYGGLAVNEPQVTLPGVGNSTEERTRALRENAQLKLPDSDTGKVAPSATAYPQGTGGKYSYVLQFADPNSDANNGQVTVKQYLGWLSSNPASPDYKKASYRTVGTYTMDSAGYGILVKGDIIGLQGTVDGRVTVAAMKDSNGLGGDVYVTDQLQYESRMNNSSFQYPDRSQLAAGGQINETYYNSLQSQANSLNDIMGIVADGNVTVPEGAEAGGAAAIRTNALNGGDPVYGNFKTGSVSNLATNGNVSNPSQIPTDSNRFFLDAIVMSTGYNGADKTFSAANWAYRKQGWIHTLGGISTMQVGDWNLFTGSSWTGGIQRYKYWDMRMSDPSLSPPFFPLTGDLTVVDDTWRMDFVSTSAG